jgi:RNA-directed DNA polymerase
VSEANIQNKLVKLDSWLRNRLRYCIWHHWNRAFELTTIGSNKSERKRKNLIRLGVEQGQAYAWSRSRMGSWAIAQSPILGTTITIERLEKRGYVPMLVIYKSISPQLNVPLLTRPDEWCERRTGGHPTVSRLLDVCCRAF